MGKVKPYTKKQKENRLEKIFVLMSEEGYSLTRACKETGVHKSSFFTWLDDLGEDAHNQYARARKMLIEYWADEVIDISNTPVLGEVTTTREDGSVDIKEGDMIAHRRLQVDSRKWILSKLAPKKYGDRLQLAGDEDSPLAVTHITRTIVDPKKEGEQDG